MKASHCQAQRARTRGLKSPAPGVVPLGLVVDGDAGPGAEAPGWRQVVPLGLGIGASASGAGFSERGAGDATICVVAVECTKRSAFTDSRHGDDATANSAFP